MKNFQVDLTYFQRNKDAWVQCKVTFHLQAENVHEALFSAVLLLEGVSFSDIEDARIEKEGYYDPPLYVHCSLFKEVINYERSKNKELGVYSLPGISGGELAGVAGGIAS